MYWIIIALFIFTLPADLADPTATAAVAFDAVQLAATYSDKINLNITASGTGVFQEWVGANINTKWALFIYHLFGLYWTVNLLEAIGLIVVAGRSVFFVFFKITYRHIYFISESCSQI